jgi:glycolate oxidase
MISTSLTNEFRSIVGMEWFLDTPEDIATYSYDSFLLEFKPSAVIIPGCTDEISKIIQVVNRERINIIPRGVGTNLSGLDVTEV